MEVLEKLRKLQQDNGWSDYKVAKQAGLAPGTVSNIYKRNTIPNICTLEAICKGFGLTLSEFFADNDCIELTPEIKEFFNDWKKLSDDKKSFIMQMIKYLL